jgi:MFS transporter, DHA3 family, macrolide efflux protein
MTGFVLNINLAELYPAPAQQPKLALAITALDLAYALPVIFGAPLAGAWADGALDHALKGSGRAWTRHR